MPIALKPFDPSRDFVAKTSFRAGGKAWSRDLPFDKAYVNDRVLRQLYEARKITYTQDDPRPAGPTVETSDLSPVEKHEEEISEAADANAPAEEEAADAPDGVTETAAAASADDLVAKYSRTQLLSIADGLELPSNATKPVIAQAIVDAGRADREPA